MTVKRVPTVVLVLGSILLLLVSLVFVAYIGVKHVIPVILTSKYEQQINQAFETNFTPELDARLKGMGVVLSDPEPAKCNDGPYSPSSPCNKYRTSSYAKLDATSAAKWEKLSKQLDGYLVEHGWELETGNRYSDFSQLIHDTSNKNYQIYAVYTKINNGVDCSIGADYIRDQPYGTYSVTEGCSKHSRSPSQWLSRTNSY